jgi:hypothetical protein
MLSNFASECGSRTDMAKGWVLQILPGTKTDDKPSDRKSKDAEDADAEG